MNNEAYQQYKKIAEIIKEARREALNTHFDAIFSNEKRNILASHDFGYGIVFARYHDITTKEITGSVTHNGKVILRITYIMDGFSPFMKYEDMLCDAIVNLIYREEAKEKHAQG